MADTVLIYSGGLDSTVLLYQLISEGRTVEALSVDYGQRHFAELNAARTIAQAWKVPITTVRVSPSDMLFQGSSQTDAGVPVPHGHYANESMRKTVVPNRNMIMLSLAAARAISIKAKCVAYGAHAGDHAIYPDCRGDFVEAMGTAFALCNWNTVELYAPFVTWKKWQIVQLGYPLGVPFAKTWSCYEGGTVHCGRCGTCVERREAFELSEIKDPTEYAQ